MAASGQDQADSSKLCGVAALALCVTHILSVVGMAYQENSLTYDKFFFVNYGLWLSPALVALLSGRVCALVGLCAIPILINFSAHICAFGANARDGAWAWWLTTFLGMISVAVVAVWLLVRFIYLITPSRSES
jgi:hypothetical protein